MISAVVPAHNEENWIGNTLKSLNNQSYPGDYEILVVDNASEDDTASVARSNGARVVYEPEKGYTTARQTGFEQAKGSIVAMTDADTIVSTNWLEAAANSLGAENTVGAFGPCEFRETSKFRKFLAKYGFSAFLRLNLLLNRPHFSGFNMAVKKKAFEKVSGFDLSMDSSADVDLSLRLKEVGKVTYNPKMSVKTSARRFSREGFLKSILHHTKNYIKVVWLRKTKNAKDFNGGRS